MQYISTRGQSEPLSFQDAVATGLAPDKGLYLPETLPDISDKLDGWQRLDYPELAFAFLRLFADDIEPGQLQQLVRTSYKKFTHPEIAPLVSLDDHLHVLELFHGPTLAFKDFALQLLGNLYETQIARTGAPIAVLGATSGDTGSAAIHGLLGKSGVQLFILYPRGRISVLQERQMTTTGAENVYPIAIEGSFDDAQRYVKDLFGDLPFKARYNLSAINSINLARILAQCVYYIWAWLRLDPNQRKQLEFVVPTGNFGNVLAGWLTQQMGLPDVAFRVATNQNDILHRLFTTGHYAIEGVQASYAPSMDIQVASNFERFLYYFVDGDSTQVRAIMQAFRDTGQYQFEDFSTKGFTSSKTTDREIAEIIKRVSQQYDYVCDPHTACGFNLPDDGRNRVLLATAHPAKFPDIIEQATGIVPTAPALEALKELPIINYPLPASESALRHFIEQHGRICECGECEA